MNHRGSEDTEERINPVSQEAVGSAIEVHRSLGPGLLESAYEDGQLNLFSVSSVPLW